MPAQLDESSLHRVVVERAQALEIEAGAREPERVLRFTPREAKPDQILLAERGEPFGRRKRIHATRPNAVALDQPRADRERCV